ncbi:MAG: M14 family zinc carboxypeptidase [Actinomycetota bacterium]
MADDARSRISRRVFLGGSIGAAAATTLPWPRPAFAANGCDPLSTPKHFRGDVPSPKDVLGFDLGVDREVTAAESRKLVQAIARSTNRVVTGRYGRSVRGRPLQYAIVGTPENVTEAGLAGIRTATARIRDPRTSAPEAAKLAETTPGIVWLIANIHGGEESGSDADLQMLYELADRDDCVVEEIVSNAIVLIIPVQNPDGREADTRRNAYGFDLNRDMFARTQPETDGKVELMRRYPPIALLDSHEFGYYSSFFPPNNDPWYHEVTSQTTHWINDVFGQAFSNAYKRENFAFFHGKVYDFFSPEYNDTVSTNGFQAAGMTIECFQDRPLNQRFARHYTVDIVAAHRAALTKAEILRGQHAAYVTAVEEGRAGKLEPNRRIFHPHKPVQEQVPDREVRHYFIEPNRNKGWELHRLLRRLQRMDVRVYQLTSDLTVPDYRPYGRPPRRTSLPAGTYWIPMAQAQKHWIQMLLNEDTYMPTVFTFGLSGWSNPLLMNLAGGSSGERLQPHAHLLFPVPDHGLTLPDAPRVGVYRMSNGSFADESVGSTEWLFDTQWSLPYTELSAENIAHGKLRDLDVLVVPGGGSRPAVKRLGDAGKREIRRFVNDGGRYVGYRGGGTRLAAELGLSTVLLSRVKVDIPGSLVRAAVDERSPLAQNVGPFVWVLFDDDFVMRTQGKYAPIRYPARKSGDFFVSGFSRYEENIYGTTAVADEAVGRGRVIVFGADPAYEGITEGMERVLHNAILGPDPKRAEAEWFGYASRVEHPPAAGSKERAGVEAAAMRAASILPDWTAMSLTVDAEDAAAASTLLRSYHAGFSSAREGNDVRFEIANPKELTLEEHPWALDLLVRLERQGVQPVSFRDR